MYLYIHIHTYIHILLDLQPLLMEMFYIEQGIMVKGYKFITYLRICILANIIK